MLKLADFKNMSDDEVIEHIAHEYKTTDIINYDILVAYESVGYYGCDSSSFFIMRNKKTGSWAFNDAYHCSCYGFENQFEPEDMPNEWFKRNDFLKHDFGGYDKESKENRTIVLKWVEENIK